MSCHPSPRRTKVTGAAVVQCCEQRQKTKEVMPWLKRSEASRVGKLFSSEAFAAATTPTKLTA